MLLQCPSDLRQGIRLQNLYYGQMHGKMAPSFGSAFFKYAPFLKRVFIICHQQVKAWTEGGTSADIPENSRESIDF